MTVQKEAVISVPIYSVDDILGIQLFDDLKDSLDRVLDDQHILICEAPGTGESFVENGFLSALDVVSCLLGEAYVHYSAVGFVLHPVYKALIHQLGHSTGGLLIAGADLAGKLRH